MTRASMIGVRVPAELKARLQAAADANDRKLSQECARRLRMSFVPALELPNGHAQPKGKEVADA